MKLHDIQKNFTARLLRPDNQTETAFDTLLAQDEVSREERLSVYRNNVLTSLTDAVVAKYPLTEKLVGEKFMRGMARRYVTANLPKTACLSDYGEDFANFIAGFAPAKALPYLPDMARLEWALHSAACAPDDVPLDLETLDMGTADQMCFKLRASCRLLSSNWPLTKIRDFCFAGENAQAPALDEGGVLLLVTRPALAPAIHTLANDEYDFLRALSRGKNLAHAAALTLAAPAEKRLSQLLERHFTLKSFSAFF